MFQPDRYLPVILNHILVYLDQDLTIFSSYTPKMTILFIQEFVISEHAGTHEFSILVECCNSLMAAIDKLGISENLDILELVSHLGERIRMVKLRVTLEQIQLLNLVSIVELLARAYEFSQKLQLEIILILWNLLPFDFVIL